MSKRLVKKIHFGIYVFWVIFFFTLFYPVLWLAAKDPQKNFSLMARIRRGIAKLSTFCSGFYFSIKTPGSIDWSRPYIICANHTSILDISALAILCKQEIIFMGKIELLANPITRMFFKTIDIAVDRNSKISSYKAFKAAQQKLGEGRSIVIFPEGKIEDTFPPVLQAFKNGAFKLAIANQAPILPVVIHELWRLLWDGGMNGSQPGRCFIEVLEPIETRTLGLGEADLLRDHVRSLFDKHLNSDVGVTN
ncbi:1-acyl-sn-glycerol-3-phosphate acyltransferase [Olivibacter sp. XZL3]|uniref:lysophospholipid acyltransferase family protein n=1 Tax=Olivibacter sp. XZL3 TaxID=1735116 RepID=UPI001066AF92|nr:lysophospholipid acyltransferase family protein [Olivibacter sp. XZL3]